MPATPKPTERELELLKVLWDGGEMTVRAVYEAVRDRLGIVQNTVQAFLRGMEEKGLVSHRTEGRSFVYRALLPREHTSRGVVGSVLERVFDGALDQLVASALEHRRPSLEELSKLRALLDDAEQRARRERKKK
jgi:predicted transcriptional regulator